jgi:ethanolamine-phosphate phospho-lyase
MATSRFHVLALRSLRSAQVLIARPTVFSSNVRVSARQLSSASSASTSASAVDIASDDEAGSFLLKTNIDESSAAATLHGGEATSKGNLGYELIRQRDKHMGPNVSVFYKQDGGVVVTEGKGAYMIDVQGNRYLDCANNVACVGHSHPAVVKAGCNALKHIQTNGRFLHPTQQRYVSKLLATFPEELNTVYFVNSGTEANDLALRMARDHTTAKNPKDVIVLDSAYHGHSQAIFEISPYKWRQATNGKHYQPPTTHVVSCPDSYRGPHRGYTKRTGHAYAKEVKAIIKETGGVGTFIAESIVGCGGQIMMPPGYLEEVYAAVRKAGGVCIADEVQTGFARTGTHFWTFQSYGVVPDIVTVGKPMGNGYPVAAVICKREVADSFASTGIEYFNTYGGNSVACSVAEAVLDTIHKEKLQDKARLIGKYFAKSMKALQTKYNVIGDVRGVGMFQGVEFVRNDTGDEITAYPALTKFVVDFLRFERIIISRDGPDANVIKFKPPLVISRADVDLLVTSVDKALQAAQSAGFFKL